MSLKSLVRLTALLAILGLLSSCSNNSTVITTNNPLYVLVTANQQLQLDVISRSTYTLAGTIPIQNVGNYPPSGAVEVGTSGSAIVTYSGTVVNGKYAVTPNTESCTLQPATCTTLINGWGNATIDKTNNHIAVPICDTSLDVSQQKCQMAFINNHISTVQKRIDLHPQMGSIVVTPDEKFLYGIVYMTNVTPMHYKLVRFDIAHHTVTATHDFGTEIPGSIAIAPDGTIYASILYTSQSTKSGTQSQPYNQPGTHVEMFTQNLTPRGNFAVEQFPLFLTISPANGGTLALTYAPQGQHRIDTFQLRTGTPIQHYMVSAYNGGAGISISTLSDGHFAAVVTSPTSFSIANFSATDSTIHWHSYDGNAISSVAG
jgi:hypothetical protein